MLKNYFHKLDREYIKKIVHEDANILDINCKDGQLLNILKPKKAVGLDTNLENIKFAKKNYKKFNFYNSNLSKYIDSHKGKNYDFIIIQDLLCTFNNIYESLEEIKKVTNNNTRLIFTYVSPIWLPIIKIAEIFKIKEKTHDMNYISNSDIANFLENNNYEIIKSYKKIIIPIYIPLVSFIANKFIANFPIINLFCLRHYIVARSLKPINQNLSTSIIIPCKNEKGNIENLFKRMVNVSNKQEIILVEGNSTDNTWNILNKLTKIYKKKYKIKLFKQSGKGKKDAVLLGFEKAKNDIIMILDADDTINPIFLKQFYKLINSNKAEFINGTRLVYPMEKKSMKFLNYVFNRIFGFLFTLILLQRFTDTLCGTKVFKRNDYIKIKKYCRMFSKNDPFGDFYLIFSATFLNLKIKELPVRYEKREYGETNISRFSDGFRLLKNLFFSFFYFKLN